MKIWYHVIAAVVGLALAALIVYVVFGAASEQGATQEGSAGSLAAEGAAMCGTIAPADTTTKRSRAIASENLPALFDQLGPIPAISDEKPLQQDWVNRVHAAGGLCIDEIRIDPEAGTEISMSTVPRVDDAAADAYAAGILAQAFTPPFNPPKVTLAVTVGDDDRTVVISRRAWNAFQIAREARNQPLTMGTLALFRQATSFGASDLRVVGWS